MANTLVRVEIDSAATEAASGRVVRSLDKIRQQSVEAASGIELAENSLGRLADAAQVAAASLGALERNRGAMESLLASADGATSTLRQTVSNTALQEDQGSGVTTIDARETFSKAVDIVSTLEILLEFLNLFEGVRTAAPGIARVLRITRLTSGLGLLGEGLLLFHDLVASSSRVQDTLPATLERIGRVLREAREGSAESTEILKEEAGAALLEAQEQLEAQRISLVKEREFLERSRANLAMGSGFFEQENVQFDARRKILEAVVTSIQLKGRIAFLETSIGALEQLIDDLSGVSSLPPIPARKPEEIIQMGQPAPPLAQPSPALGQQASPIQVPQSVCQSLEEAEAASQSFAGAAQQAFEDYASAATDAGAQVEQIIGGSLMNMENALVRFVQTGQLNFRALVDSLIADLIRLTIRAAILGPLARALGAAFGPGGGVGVGSNVLSGGNTPFEIGSGNFTINGAQGLNFTVPPGFPGDSFFAPLALTSGERVKVTPSNRFQAGEASDGSVVNVTVINQAGAEVETRERPNGRGGVDLELLITRAVARDITRGGPVARSVLGLTGTGPALIGR